MNKSDAPKISIIIPVYNAEKYLRQCLDSVVNQTLKEIEILCINDGSTDSSLDILNEYAEQDKRIKVFSQKNSGPATARNVGLDNATGDYLWFIDADDWCELNACEYLYKEIQNFSEIDYVHFGTNIFDNQKKITNKDAYYNLTIVPEKFINTVISELNEKNISILYNLPNELWSKLFRKKFISKNKIRFNDELKNGDDALFSSLAFLKAKSRIYKKECLYNYRIFVDDSICNLMRNKKCTFYNYPLKIGKNIINCCEEIKLNKNLYKDIIKKEIWRIFKTFNLIDKNNKKKYYTEIKKYIKQLPPQIYTKEILKYSGYFKDLKFIKNHTYVFYALKQYFKTKKIKLPKLKKKNKDKISATSLRDIIRNEINNTGDVIYLHTKVFPKYKNINKEKEVILVATGPTLDDFMPIKNAIYIGVNKAFECSRISLDYLFLCDYNGAKKYIKKANQYEKKTCKKFYGLYQNVMSFESMTIPESDVIEANAERFIVNGIDENFHYNIETRPLPPLHSTIFPAAAFALYTCPSKIYLVGCDCTPDKSFNSEQRIWTNSYEKENHQRKIIEGWQKFKKFAQTYYPDTEIISINPVGLKGFFKDIYTNKEPEKSDD